MIWSRMLGSFPGSVFLLAFAIRFALVSSVPAYQNSSSVGNANVERNGIRVPASHFVAPRLPRIVSSDAAHSGKSGVGGSIGTRVRIGNIVAQISNGGFTTFDGGGWTVPITIGGQPLTLNIDTGSSDLWTASTLMSAAQQESITTGQIWDANRSGSFQVLRGYTFNIAYADGSAASGPVAKSDVTISGVTVSNFAFGVASNIKYTGGQENGTRQTDGPLGLGFGAENSIRPSAQCTFMECLSSQLPNPVFSTALKLNDSGYIDFGVIRKGAYSGQMTTVPVNNATANNPGQWVVEKVQVAVGSTKLTARSFSLNFDIGGPGMVLPEDVAAQYFSHVKGASNNTNSYGLWTYPCDQDSPDLPDLTFVFGTVLSGPSSATIPGSILGDAILTSTKDPQLCFTKIQTTAVGGVGNAGVPFYTTNYMVFDQSQPALSFAQQAN